VSKLPEGTRLEVRQIPLDTDLAPVLDRRKSEGEFLAWSRGEADPVSLEGSAVTVVGEVLDSTTVAGERRVFPTIEVIKLTVWDQRGQPSPPYVYDPFYRAQWGYRPTVKGGLQ
jgi:starvation-inducible outer membrane lipoprotein